MSKFKELMSELLYKISLLEYKVKYVSDNPDYGKINKNEIIVVGGEKHAKWAYFKCPSGCEDIIVLPLIKSEGPSWKLKIDKLGRPTLFPSIWKMDGCRSHFFIKKGKVVWAKDY